MKRSKIYLLLFIGTVLSAFAIVGIMAAGLISAIEAVPCWLLDMLTEQGWP